MLTLISLWSSLLGTGIKVSPKFALEWEVELCESDLLSLAKNICYVYIMVTLLPKVGFMQALVALES